MRLPLDPCARAGGSPSAHLTVPSQTLLTPSQHLYHRAQQDVRPNHQELESPLPVLEYQRLASQYLDAARFVWIPSVRKAVKHDAHDRKRANEEFWRAYWAHLSFPRGVYPTRTFGLCDMPYVRCPEEIDYQARLQHLLKRIQDDTNVPIARHHNLRELLVFNPPFNNLYWMQRSQWGDNAATKARMRSSLRYVYCWLNVESHDLTASDCVGLHSSSYAYKLSQNLSVPTPPVLSYHTSKVLGLESFSNRIFQIV